MQVCLGPEIGTCVVMLGCITFTDLTSDYIDLYIDIFSDGMLFLFYAIYESFKYDSIKFTPVKSYK